MKKPIDSEKMERARRALEVAEKKPINQGSQISYGNTSGDVIDLFLSVYNHKSVNSEGRRQIISYLNQLKEKADETFEG